MTESDRVDRVILRLPAVRGGLFLLFLCAAWAVGYEYARGYGLQAAVALAAMLGSFLTLAWTFKGRTGHAPLADEPRRRAARTPNTSAAWPRHLFKIERDKALHTIRSVLAQRASCSEAPQAIWQREMRQFVDYVEGRCGALALPVPGDLGEKVMWADRQSLMAKDYAEAMAVQLARIIEGSGAPSD